MMCGWLLSGIAEFSISPVVSVSKTIAHRLEGAVIVIGSFVSIVTQIRQQPLRRIVARPVAYRNVHRRIVGYRLRFLQSGTGVDERFVDE
jgi:hypothetical protein